MVVLVRLLVVLRLVVLVVLLLLVMMLLLLAEYLQQFHKGFAVFQYLTLRGFQGAGALGLPARRFRAVVGGRGGGTVEREGTEQRTVAAADTRLNGDRLACRRAAWSWKSPKPA